MLVRRKAAEATEMERLIQLLAQEIPTESERRNFLSNAKIVLSGPR
jgi:hypothetical protein